MRTAGRLLLRIVGYAALALVIATAAILVYVSMAGLCQTFNEARVTCVTPGYQALAEFALGVAIAAIFTGLPLLLALMGLVFLFLDVRAWRRRRNAQAPSIT